MVVTGTSVGPHAELGMAWDPAPNSHLWKEILACEGHVLNVPHSGGKCHGNAMEMASENQQVDIGCLLDAY